MRVIKDRIAFIGGGTSDNIFAEQNDLCFGCLISLFICVHKQDSFLFFVNENYFQILLYLWHDIVYNPILQEVLQEMYKKVCFFLFNGDFIKGKKWEFFQKDFLDMERKRRKDKGT